MVVLMLRIFLAAALLIAPAPLTAGVFDEAECKNLGTPYDLDDTLNRLNKRIIACFNYQKELAPARCELSA
jgi:hypothetical protein